MTIAFYSHKESAIFHDPMQDGKRINRETEIRLDPLTKETSRILFDPGAPFQPKDYSELGKSTSGSKCPFCEENIWKSTPTYPDELVPEGRIANGEAVLFPNLFPYAKHNAVVRMTSKHYVPLDEFTKSTISRCLKISLEYLLKIAETDEDATHFSINWNYLPPSGGSILHPHMHVLAYDQPTQYEKQAKAASQLYAEQYGSSYYADFLAKEQQLHERWVGKQGSLHWVHAFAPKSHFDFIGLLEHMPSLTELKEQDIEDVADSLLRIFAYFRQVGLASFNMMMILPKEKNSAHPVQIRLVPRLTLGALGTSDMNVLTFLHGEYLSLKSPEQNAREAAAFFK